MSLKTVLAGYLLIVFGIFFYPTISIGQTQRGANINGDAVGGRSGHSVSMPDANTVAIGAPEKSANGSSSGQVRVYSWNGSAWVQKGADINGRAAGDQFGYALSMPDANTVAIGAPYNNDGGGSSGQVRIYSWNGSAWVQKGADINGEAAASRAGWSVSMPDANTLAIGAPYYNPGGGSFGQVCIYGWSGSGWVQKGVSIIGEAKDDWSGWCVSMPDANTLAIGATGNDGGGNNSGQVRVYTWNGASSWVQKGANINGEVVGGRSGYSVSMPDANTVAIGAPENNANGGSSGQVRVYSFNASAWVQKGANINGEAAGNEYGYSVSMPDANTLALGAPGTHEGGNIYSGQVRVYSFNGSAWMQKGTTINGEAILDQCRVASMPNANTVAIGAPGYDGGHVNVYDFASLPVIFGAVNASIRLNTLTVHFTSRTETNNDHFVVEASANGVDFTEISRIPSKAPGGSSTNDTEYSVSINMDGGTSYSAIIIFALLGALLFLSKRNRKWIAAGMLVCMASFISCEKNADASITNSDLFIRIAQVDKDGTTAYSKVVKVGKD